MSESINIRLLTRDDLDSFLSLAAQVEPLFGPMVAEDAFLDGLQNAIASESCFCGVDAHGEITGAVIIDRQQNEICWLAVAGDRRGTGLGRALLDEAVEKLDSHRPIRVQTFAENIVEGLAARKLYLTYGFIDKDPGEKNPAGFQTVWMVRPVLRAE